MAIGGCTKDASQESVSDPVGSLGVRTLALTADGSNGGGATGQDAGAGGDAAGFSSLNQQGTKTAAAHDQPLAPDTYYARKKALLASEGVTHVGMLSTAAKLTLTALQNDGTKASHAPQKTELVKADQSRRAAYAKALKSAGSITAAQKTELKRQIVGGK